MKRMIAAVVAATVGASMFLAMPTAQAVVPGDFGSATTLEAGGILPASPSAATLITGAVAVAYPLGSSIKVRIRKPGATAFGPEITRPLPAGYSFAVTGTTLSAPGVSIAPLSATSFALAWGECLGPCRVVSVNLPVNAVSIGAPTVVSRADSVLAIEPRFAITADGSAALAWLVNDVGGLGVRVSHRAGTSGAWSAPVTAGITNLPFTFRVAIDSSRSLTTAWAVPAAADIEVRVRSRVNGAWGLTTVASTFPVAAFSGSSDVYDLAAVGSSTVLAALTGLAGSSNYYVPTPVGVRVLSREATSTNFTVTVAGATGPGRYAVQPTVSVAPNGGAVVRFADLTRMVLTPPNHTQVTSLVVQRRTRAGAWAEPTVIDAVGVADPTTWFSAMRFRPSLLSDGTYLTPSMRSIRVGAVVAPALGLQVRGGWGSALSDAEMFGEIGVASAATALTNVTGRATMVYFSSLGVLVESTSSLAKPVAVARASLSTTSPRRGTAVTCRVTWAEATSVRYQWLRNGAAISGAAARSYTPRSADVGKQLTCRSVGRNAMGPVASVALARSVGS